jgi:hypothetical protein
MREESHSRYDPDLGWSHRPGLRMPDLYGPGRGFTTNAQGFRNTEDITKAVPAGRYRVIALGDSFTMGYGVGDAASYPAQLQSMCPGLQVVNMGQGGYGLDQAYLWYKRDGAALDAQLLVVAVIAHDFFRMAGDSFIGYAKPVLRVREGKLVTENVPVPQNWGLRTPLTRARTFFESLAMVRIARWALGKGQQGGKAEQFYGELTAEVKQAAGLALDDLARTARARGKRLVLVYLPIADLVPKEPTPEAAWLQEHARGRGIAFIDMVAPFRALPAADFPRMFLPDNHYTDEGNRLVAATLAAELRKLDASMPDCPAAPRR